MFRRIQNIITSGGRYIEYNLIKKDLFFSQFFITNKLIREFSHKHQRPTYGRNPLSDPHHPKKGVKKHKIKQNPDDKIKKDPEVPIHEGEDNLILKFPVRYINPYVKDVPKRDRHKEDKNTVHRVGVVPPPEFYTEYKDNSDMIENDVEIPETMMPEVMTPNTPTTKIRVKGHNIPRNKK